MNIYSKVKANFSNADAYSKNSSVQDQVRNLLLEYSHKYSKLINYHHIDNILNLGVRDFSEPLVLNQKFQPKNIDIADITPPKETHKNKSMRSFKVNFDKDLDLIDGNYDLIFSNMSFQWSQNFELLIKNISQKLNNRSILAFSTVLEQNFKEIDSILRINKMHNMSSIINYIKKHELKCLHDEDFYISLEFNNFKDLIKHLKSTGVNTYTGNNRPNYTNIKKLYLNSGKFKLSYHIGIFICFKE